MNVKNSAKASNVSAAKEDRQPLSGLSCNTCPFRAAQPSCLHQPLAVPSAPATLGKCPFAAPIQESRQQQGLHDPDIQGCLQSTDQTTMPQLKPLTDAESASASAVDLKAVEAELDSFADTFAIHPDEALLHAYASLLAEKVAEADIDPSSGSSTTATKQVHSAADVTSSSSQSEAVLPSQTFRASSPEKRGTQTGMDMQRRPWSCDDHARTQRQTQGQTTQSQTLTHSQSQAPLASGKSQHGQLCNTDNSNTLLQPACFAESCPAGADSFVAATTATAAACAGASEGLKAGAIVVPTGLWGSLLQGLQCCWEYMSKHSVAWHTIMVACFGIQLAMAAYFGLVHQRYAMYTILAVICCAVLCCVLPCFAVHECAEMLSA